MTISDANSKSHLIQTLDIVKDIIEIMRIADISEKHLTDYIENNSALLKSNISQAQAKYSTNNIREVINMIFPQYTENRERILKNYRHFFEVKDQVIEKIYDSFGNNVPKIVLVPCIGLFSAGGWADNVDGTYHIFVALERLPADFNIEVLLAHEITHGISEIEGDTVLGGFYNEGFATYVSSALYPGYNEETYFFSMNAEVYDRYLDWIDKNRDKILIDSARAFRVLDEVHKFYFTSSFSPYPNIGYVIGFRYLSYLHNHYTLEELRTFGINLEENQKEFKAFIANATFERSG